jgi:CO dehydrogenase/acetyl-CoA synthase alpha subunit
MARTEERKRWEAGLCPCCAGDICEWTATYDGTVYEPEPIAEGVMMCGRCIGNEHHAGEFNVVPLILAALVPGASA